MITIRSFEKSHFPAVKTIYQQGIDTGNATFQEQAKDWQEWDASLISSCRLVAELDDRVVGWAALSAVSSRCVYSGVAEVSVYVDTGTRGRGIGHLLLQQLITESEEHGIWTLQAGIFPENKASVAIHLKNGFKKLGIRERLGKMNEQWRDVLLMERRSRIVGL